MGPLLQGLSQGYNQGVSQGFAISRLTWGRVGFQAHSLQCLSAGFSSLQAVGLRASVAHWILATGHTQFLSRGPLQCSSFLHQSKHLRRRDREKESQQDRTRKPVFYNLTTEVIAHHSRCVLLVRSKSPGLAHTQGKGAHGGLKTRRQG